MVKNYEITNKTNECEVYLKQGEIFHKFIFSKVSGYTKKFYEKLLYDIENNNKGDNYDAYINEKIEDFPIMTCNNGELYFMNMSTFLGMKTEIKLSNELSRGILTELISYLC